MSFKSDALKPLTSRVAVRGIFDAAETLAATKTLTKRDGQFLKLDPGGANRDVVLPAVGRDDHGYFFFIGNAADNAEDLVVKNAADTSVATVNQNEAGVLYVDAAGAWQLWGVVGFGAT